MACAWEAAKRGLRPCGRGAGERGGWQVAAGMLAPVAESDFGEQALTGLGIRAAEGFAAYCAELAEASGEDPGFRANGTLIVARDRDDAEVLDRLLAFRRSLGLPVERLRPSQARHAEPALAPTVRLALDVPGDHSADPRKLVAALATAVERAGGEIRRRAPPAPAPPPPPRGALSLPGRPAGRRRDGGGAARGAGRRRLVLPAR